MEAKIVRIGNSQGVRLEVVEETIVIHPERNVRQGWKAAFAKAGAPDAEDLWQGVPHDEVWDK